MPKSQLSWVRTHAATSDSVEPEGRQIETLLNKVHKYVLVFLPNKKSIIVFKTSTHKLTSHSQYPRATITVVVDLSEFNEGVDPTGADQNPIPTKDCEPLKAGRVDHGENKSKGRQA